MHYNPDMSRQLDLSTVLKLIGGNKENIHLTTVLHSELFRKTPHKLTEGDIYDLNLLLHALLHTAQDLLEDYRSFSAIKDPSEEVNTAITGTAQHYSYIQAVILQIEEMLLA